MTILICATAFGGSLLTFFSGFGLGTVLMPVFGIFFPIQEAVALTAIVHLLNDFFKASLIGKYANKTVLIRFGIVALIFSFLGAKLLGLTSGIPSLKEYSIAGKFFEILPVKLVIAILIFVFTLIELLPFLNKFKVHAKYLPIGGALSGFFGGFSGHQGALRTMFLSKLKLSKEAFIGTGAMIAVLIDTSRLIAYSTDLFKIGLSKNVVLVICATISAMAGAWIGNKRLKKITMDGVHKIVAVTLLLFAVALGAGLI